MSRLAHLFQSSDTPATDAAACWLWLLSLKDGRTVQATFSPPAERAQVESLTGHRHGAELLRVVPVPGAGRLLTPGEVGRVLAGLSPSAAQAEPTAAATWLARVAWHLECTPAQLLASGKVTPEDAAECAGTAPHLAAELIRSDGWTCPPPVPEPRREPSPRRCAVRPAAWLAARDTYLAHVMACPKCVAHRLREPIHCTEGAELRRQYDTATLTSTQQ